MEETTELVYRTMLAHPSEGFDRIRELTGLAEADLRTQLNRLSELALVRPRGRRPEPHACRIAADRNEGPPGRTAGGTGRGAATAGGREVCGREDHRGILPSAGQRQRGDRKAVPPRRDPGPDPSPVRRGQGGGDGLHPRRRADGGEHGGRETPGRRTAAAGRQNAHPVPGQPPQQSPDRRLRQLAGGAGGSGPHGAVAPDPDADHGPGDGSRPRHAGRQFHGRRGPAR